MYLSNVLFQLCVWVFIASFNNYHNTWRWLGFSFSCFGLLGNQWLQLPQAAQPFFQRILVFVGVFLCAYIFDFALAQRSIFLTCVCVWFTVEFLCRHDAFRPSVFLRELRSRLVECVEKRCINVLRYKGFSINLGSLDVQHEFVYGYIYDENKTNGLAMRRQVYIYQYQSI